MTTQDQQAMRRSAGRPSVPVLSRKKILDTALSFVQKHGSEELTIARLAKRLRVSPSALYNHIKNKAQLFLLLQDELMSRVSVESMEALIEGQPVTLTEALNDWSRSYLRVFAENPSLIPVIAVTPIAGAPKTMRMYDTVAQALRTSGIPEPQILPTIIAFESFLYGSAMDTSAPPTLFKLSAEDSELAALHQAVDSFALSIAIENHNNSVVKNPSATAPFELGLEALINHTISLTQGQ